MYTHITPEQVEEWRQKGAKIIDVREEWEYSQGRIPGAENVPLHQIPDKASECEGPVIVVCASGGRSQQAAQYLASMGVPDVANLSGGTSEWVERGLPVEQ